MLNHAERLSRPIFAYLNTGQGTCRVPAYPKHWSGYLQSAEDLHTPDTSQGTCRVPAYPNTGQGTCRVQSTCIHLTLVRVPAEYPHTPETWSVDQFLHSFDANHATKEERDSSVSGVCRYPQVPWLWWRDSLVVKVLGLQPWEAGFKSRPWRAPLWVRAPHIYSSSYRLSKPQTLGVH